MNAFSDAPQPQSNSNKAQAQVSLKLDRRAECVLLFERKYDQFRLLAFYYLDSMEEAHDVVAYAFEGALHRWPEEIYNRINSLEAYTAQAIINGCLNILKRRKRFLSVNDIPLDTILVSNPMTKFDLDIESLAKQLPDKQGEAFLLFWKGHSHAEIVKLMNLKNESASTSLVHYAKKNLRKLLWREFPEYDPDDNGSKQTIKNKQKNGRKTTVSGRPGLSSSPRFKDLLRIVTEDCLDERIRAAMIKWLATEQTAFEVISGLNRAIQQEPVEIIVTRFRKDKDSLRNRLFGVNNADIAIKTQDALLPDIVNPLTGFKCDRIINASNAIEDSSILNRSISLLRLNNSGKRYCRSSDLTIQRYNLIAICTHAADKPQTNEAQTFATVLQCFLLSKNAFLNNVIKNQQHNDSDPWHVCDFLPE